MSMTLESLPVEVTGDGFTTVHASSVSRALRIIGDRSALLVTYCLFLGIRRFGDIQSHTGISRSQLSTRLERLAQQDILARRQYQQRPQRFEYVLTAMGRDLFDVSLALIRWDKRWHYEPDCLTHQLVHQQCGKCFTPEMVCNHCGEAAGARDISWQPGPGWGVDPRPPLGQSRRSRLTREALAHQHAIMVRALEILGDRWTSQIIAAAFYRVRHFNALQKSLGIATNILSDRLERLLEIDVLRHNPASGEYRLTAKGLDLYPLVVCLLRWGDRWLDDGKGAPLLLTHNGCGQKFVPRMVCDRCTGDLEYLNFALPAEALS